MTSIRDDGTVEFRFFRPAVGQVKLAGDFSEWARNAVSMRTAGDGWWTAQLKLAPGEYRFRYIADEKWFTDFASHGVEKCKTGWNSVLVVRQIATTLKLSRDKTSAKALAA